MRYRCIAALVTAALLTLGPALAQAQVPAAAPQAPSLSAAHVVAVDGSSRRELTSDAAQIAHTEMTGPNNGNMMASMGTNMVLSAASVVAGPIGAIAAPIIGLFGHHPQPKPTMHAILALPGSTSSIVLSDASPSFTIDYGDIPGINPDVYTPELVKLAPTNDNWRVIGTSESSDPGAFASLSTNGMLPAGMTGTHETPKIAESRVDYAAITIASRGHAAIALSHPLDPGEYGIVLRPVASSSNFSPASFLTVWDFSVH